MITQSAWLYSGEAVELENQTIRASVKILFLGVSETKARTQSWRVLEENKLLEEWGNMSPVEGEIDSLGLSAKTVREARACCMGIEILPIIEV